MFRFAELLYGRTFGCLSTVTLAFATYDTWHEFRRYTALVWATLQQPRLVSYTFRKLHKLVRNFLTVNCTRKLYLKARVCSLAWCKNNGLVTLCNTFNLFYRDFIPKDSFSSLYDRNVFIVLCYMFVKKRSHPNVSIQANMAVWWLAYLTMRLLAS